MAISDEYGSTYCAPIFLSKPFMQDGHTAEKANGTMTFVKYQNAGYAVTCSHVYHQQKLHTSSERHLTAVGNSKTVFQFGGYGPDVYVSAFKALQKTELDNENPDIAIAPVGRSFIELYMLKNNKDFIDLDNWIEPDWGYNCHKLACGYATEHKVQTETHVLAAYFQAILEPTLPANPTRNTFSLFSSLEKEHNLYFSGMSGGPVFTKFEESKNLSAIGIIFEGTPGSSKEWALRDEGAFFTGSDVKLDALLLTPSIFKQWLQMADLL